MVTFERSRVRIVKPEEMVKTNNSLDSKGNNIAVFVVVGLLLGLIFIWIFI